MGRRRRKRRFNYRLILVVMTGILLISGGVFAFHQYQVRRQAGLLVRQAQEHEQKGELAQAADVWKRYLAVKPDNTLVRMRYGLLLDKLATTPREKFQALSTLDQALRSDPDNEPARRRALALAMEIQQYPAARAHLDALAQSSPEDAALEDLRGRCFEGEGKLNEAVAAYEASLAHNPKSVDTAVRLATLLADQLDRLDRARLVMDALVAADPKSAQPLLKRAVFRGRHKLKGEEDDIAQARVRDPNDPDVIVASSALSALREGAEASKQEVERGIKLHPEDVRLYRLLADLELRDGHVTDAIEALRRGLKAVPEETDLNWFLGDLLLQSGRKAEAEEVIAAIRQIRNFPKEPLEYLEAEALAAEAKWVEASRKLEDLMPRLQRWPQIQRTAFLILGRCYAQTGDADRRQEVLRRATSEFSPQDPLWAVSHLELGDALQAQGRMDEALAEFQLVQQKSPTTAALAVAKLTLLRALSQNAPQRKWEVAERAINEAARITPDAPEVPILRAEMLQARGDLGAAREVLVAARQRWPERTDLVLVLAALSGRERKFDEAKDLLEQAKKSFGDRPEIRLGLARLIADRREATAASEILALASDAAAFNVEEKKALYSGLLNPLLRVGAINEARSVWGELVKLQPDNLSVLATDFDLAMLADDDAGLTRALDAFRALEGDDGTFWHLGKVFMIVRQKRKGEVVSIPEAREHLARVAPRKPNSSRVALAQAELDDLDGNTSSAAKNYFRAIELGETAPNALRRGARLLYDEKRFNEAEQIVKRLTDTGLLTDDLRRIACELALRGGDQERALTLAQAPVAAGSKNPDDHLWLGQVLWAISGSGDTPTKPEDVAKRRGQAEKALRGAIETSGGLSTYRASLVLFLVATQQKDKAEAEAKLIEALPPDQRKTLDLAQCREVLGDLAKARELYQEALSAKPNDPTTLRAVAASELRQGRLKIAEPILTKLIGSKELAPNDASWARQALGVTLALAGDYRQSQRALRVLGIGGEGEAGAAMAGSIEDRRTDAKVLALQQSPGQRRRAVKILEDLAGEKLADETDRFLLAQLYDLSGEWTKARDLLLALVASDQRQPSHVAYLAERLLARGQVDEAATWAAALDKSDPAAFQTVALKARVLNAQGQSGAALATIQAFLKRLDAQTYLLEAAKLLEQISMSSPAEALYRQAAAQTDAPQNALALAGFLGRQGRTKDAVDALEAARTLNPPEDVSATAIKILFAARTDLSQCERVERWLKEDIAKYPDRNAIPFDLANLYILLERYKDAESIYRELAQRNTKESLALNNLAWLLALHGGRAEEAIELIDRAMTMEGPRPELLDTRGVARIIINRPDLAIQDLKEALAENPRPETYFHLAQAYWKLNDRKNAADVLEKAKTAGLRVDTLDPVERANYSRLVADLSRG